MKKQSMVILASALLLAGASSSALAETALTPKAQFAADSKQAQARYESDKKLCDDETSSSSRLQCRRDAKAEYDKAIAAAKAQMAAAGKVAEPTATHKATDPRTAACADCGHVTAISVTEKEGEGGALGILAGGAAGALLGHQVGGGSGKDLATIAGAVGGAYAGKKVEEKMKTHKVWTVSVQYASGSKNNFAFDQDPGLKVGDQVKNSGNTIVRY